MRAVDEGSVPDVGVFARREGPEAPYDQVELELRDLGQRFTERRAQRIEPLGGDGPEELHGDVQVLSGLLRST